MTYRFLIANNTTSHYFDYNGTEEDCNNILKELLTITTDKTSHKYYTDIGESFWKKTDNIVFVPKHLEPYVENHYGKIYITSTIINKDKNTTTDKNTSNNRYIVINKDKFTPYTYMIHFNMNILLMNLIILFIIGYYVLI